ncbi:hypothetical protein HYN48_09550 [Flavobacterium magnum]|uniref:Uncharacterized protein n=1 Tax=Flavobacterium magnum TaxID=2162713 RepID=A0A2S0RFK4_9FLAO|nr:hypothetical protein [Flavobacterium magnum]AWA30309.1 hypothetical protein HYN48_09550 [Flavobacterium magnum]
MDGLRFIGLRKKTQEIIDLIGHGDLAEAKRRLTEAQMLLEDLLDHSTANDDVIEAGHYQALLAQLEKRV